MITSKDYLKNALKMADYVEKPDNESRRKLEEEIDEMENERKVNGQVISGQEFLDVEDLKIEDADEERNEEYEVNVRQLLCQETNNEYADVSDCESDSEGSCGSNWGSGSEYDSDVDVKVKSIRAHSVIDVFSGRMNTQGKYAKMKEPSFPIIQRTDVQTALRRKRGRPKKAVSRRLLPMLDKPRHTVNFDITHQALSRYKELVGKIFADPNTNRPYIVTVVCYNKTLKKSMAYQRSLDDLAPDPFDDHPFEIEGNEGIEKLVEEYRQLYDRELRSIYPELNRPNTEAEMLEIQKQDNQLGPIIALVLSYVDDPENPKSLHKIDERRSYQFKKLQEGNMSALRMIDTGKPGRIRAVVPSKLIPQLIMMYHDQQGHPGYDRTAATIKNNYYWYRMDENIETYIMSCNYCQSYKSSRRATVPIQAYGAPSMPWRVVHIDLTGQKLPESRRGNKLILVAKCSLTRCENYSSEG